MKKEIEWNKDTNKMKRRDQVTNGLHHGNAWVHYKQVRYQRSDIQRIIKLLYQYIDSLC
jgi:hypothetical protein